MAKEELKLVEPYEKCLKKKSIKELFALMSSGRKELITPIYVPDDKYIEAWSEEAYEPMGFDLNMDVYCSNGGVRLR